VIFELQLKECDIRIAIKRILSATLMSEKKIV